METRTAVVLDRHPLWLDALEDVLLGICVEVQGKTTQPAEALELVEDLRPDVFVCEPQTGRGETGAGVVREALERHDTLKVIVLSSSDDTDDIDAAFEAGAGAYVFKTARAEDVASAVRQAFDVSMLLAPIHAARTTRMGSTTARADRDDPGLTKRETEILRLVSDGHSNGDLARMLWVTEQTVKFHLSNIYRKLDVSNRTEASRWAQVHGLLAPAPPKLAAVAG